MPVHYVPAEAVEARRGLQILWNGIYITVVSHWELNLLLPQALGSVIYKIKDSQPPLKKFLVIFFDSLFSFSHSSVCIFCGDLQHLLQHLYSIQPRQCKRSQAKKAGMDPRWRTLKVRILLSMLKYAIYPGSGFPFKFIQMYVSVI